jgi:uncharacterized protein YlzI (FlbEa/FlbD family)
MDTDIIRENVNKIAEYNRTIRLIKEEKDDVKIELRVFTKGSWSTVDFKPDHKPAKNYVICQLILDLNNKIKECENIIKKEVNK